MVWRPAEWCYSNIPNTAYQVQWGKSCILCFRILYFCPEDLGICEFIYIGMLLV